MTYPCTECILGMLHSSGPQNMSDLRRECCTQAVPYTPELFDLALGELIGTGKMVVEANDDDPYFDLPPSYYESQL